MFLEIWHRKEESQRGLEDIPESIRKIEELLAKLEKIISEEENEKGWWKMESENGTYKVTLEEVPEFGKLQVLYKASDKNYKEKASKLKEIFSGNTQISDVRWTFDKNKAL